RSLLWPRGEQREGLSPGERDLSNLGGGGAVFNFGGGREARTPPPATPNPAASSLSSEEQRGEASCLFAVGCSQHCVHAGIFGLDAPSKQYPSLLLRTEQRMRRFVYCKVVLATSLMWVLVDVFLLLYFSECNKCDDKKERSLLPALRDARQKSTLMNYQTQVWS
uniref:Uncharacterized protein n=1 Tax=Podarcis muralis TaxID=64176 RepID=A0A670IL12_PODMU